MARSIPPVERTNKMGFEIETCGRCGGTGNYSFCTMHGTTCFGCGGSGVCYTKRGKAARYFYLESLCKPVEQIEVGDSIYETIGLGSALRWHTVTAKHEPDAARFGSINGEPFGSLELSRKGKVVSSNGWTPRSTFRSVRNEEERKAKLAAALEYQATLGKSGKAPAARKTKEAA